MHQPWRTGTRDRQAMMHRWPHACVCLQGELRLHSRGLADRPSLVVANKMDQLPGGASSPVVQQLAESCQRPLVAVSGLLGDNIPALQDLLRRMTLAEPDA